MPDEGSLEATLMLSFTRAQLRLLIAAGLTVALSATLQWAGARFAHPLVLVQAEESGQSVPDKQPASERSYLADQGAPENGPASAQNSAQGQSDLAYGADERPADQHVRDLNQMSFDDFVELPGIGPVIAQRIIDYRAAHGPFVRVEQLLDVPGIGPARFLQLLPLVTVGVKAGPEPTGTRALDSDELAR